MLKQHKRRVIAASGLLTALLATGVLFMQPADMNAHGLLGGERLNKDEVRTIINQAIAAANTTQSATGIRSNGAGVVRATKMQIAVVNRHGAVLAEYAMPDAWSGSAQLAIGKARTAAFFSSDENALTSRVIGVLSQAHNPDGSGGAGPFWGVGNSQGIITFPGGLALYKNGELVGGIGVSGDAVDQDEFVAFAGAAGFLPGPDVIKLGYTPPSVPQVP